MREPRWDKDWEIGQQGELYVADTLKSLSSGAAYEVKTDERAADTGRLYVEYECKGKPSGIKTTEAALYVFVIAGRMLLVLPTADLKTLARRAYRDPSNRVECPRGSHPTKGVAIPIAYIPSWLNAKEEAA